jgi:hypothetical protein
VTTTNDLPVAAIVDRVLPVVADLKRVTAQADDMFFAVLGLPSGAVKGVARVFSEALGHEVYIISKAISAERALSHSQQLAVRHQVLMAIYRQLPPAEAGVDAAADIERPISQYRRKPASKREWNRSIASYVAELERLFNHRNGTEVRRAGTLVFDAFLPQTTKRTIEALEGPGA